MITRLGTYSEIKGSSIKIPCVVATTGAITLSGTQTIDGVAVAVGDRVLVKNQGTASTNGIYIVSASTWARAVDMSLDDDTFTGLQVYITSGTVNGGKFFGLTTANPIVLGTTSLSFAISVAPATGGSYVPYSGATGNVDLGSYTITSPSFLGNATSATYVAIVDDVTSNTYYYPTWSNGITAASSLAVSSTKLKYKPLTGELQSTIFTGALNGNAATATLAANSSLLQGYGASTSATAATIALRDGNGDLTSRWFLGSKFIVSGGTSSQFLKADGSVDANTYLTTSSASSTYLPLAGGTLTGALSGTSATFSSSVTATQAFINGAAGNNYIAFNSSTNIGYVGDANWIFGGSTSDFGIRATNNLVFGIGASEKMRITSGGNVGIGTTSPSTRLTVQDASNTYSLNISGNNQTNGVAIGTNSSNVASIQGYTRTFSATNNIAIQPDGGNLLIGIRTDNGAMLQVNGAATFSSSVTAGQIGVQAAPLSGVSLTAQENATNGVAMAYVNRNSTKRFDFIVDVNAVDDKAFGIYDRTNGAYRFNITDAGNVGIGTTSPSYLLDVNGTGRFSSSVTSQVNNITADGAGVVLQGYVDNNLRIAVRGSGYNSGSRGGLLASTGDFSGALTASTLGINGTADNVKSGTYTPTLTRTGGTMTSISAVTANYMRVGNAVNVFATFYGTPAAGTNQYNAFTMTLPFSQTSNNGGGSIVAQTIGNIPSAAGYVAIASATTVNFDINTNYNAPNTYFTLTFQYLIT